MLQNFTGPQSVGFMVGRSVCPWRAYTVPITLVHTSPLVGPDGPARGLCPGLLLASEIADVKCFITSAQVANGSHNRQRLFRKAIHLDMG